ncbi:helix-turn-helix domain-containing protein [Amycolatopsis jiangsuensis]|uniref:DNA-binding Xre family transcriptional regulator n=1 Tax=Amycolatopsis jiangsuensis TaxID=1181879 RepID=A0A840IY55_9PSEU|nr:helix-turn-helix transcriptional regulator [Amycolatopsis jiangsuensis]MBB4686325.1 DNA-binding Xre family transcriptional regulator [Amycolatopsis jiangsuensis]
MAKAMTFEWHLRLRMAERGMFQTSYLVKPLHERGISLSREQVYRLVTSPPQRLSMDVFAALCDILECQPNDLIEIKPTAGDQRKAVGGSSAAPTARRSTIRRPEPS